MNQCASVRVVLLVLSIVCVSGAFVSAARADDANLRIDEPERNAIITTSAMYVSGTAMSQTTNFGITVNGFAAEIDLSRAGTKADPFRWSAEVHAPAGRVKLKARFHRESGSDDEKDTDDESSASVRHVQFSPPAASLRLLANPPGGVAPLAVEFSILSDATDTTKFEADLNGDGLYETTSARIPEQLAFTYTTPGIRRASVRLTRSDGSIATAYAAITAQSFSAIDTLLKAVWHGFRQDLANRRIDAAMAHLSPGARPEYERAFNLIRPSLPSFAAGLNTIEPVWIRGSAAHYLLTRMEEGRLRGYQVYFVRDGDGLWRIAQF